ncbi:MAG: penicillin-binding protein 1C [Bosea sp.]|uniref:penicillin-binding protein 1C n=1 Tax=unclassified Bosea (in: a-proteobacteria) TaxID=2653178 RepID=UPI0009665B9C|nr:MULTISPECIES: penicillin-binding protein 1C [unclassified Bosea (in: a-proteobacteria)]MBN9455410.1 penicillin-binding protein 1C [Bosea sp. (in: a-proteobacteria)]OJV05016.1 MAG: penicillin-binding protein 1C [Bosea sp. 67-29]
MPVNAQPESGSATSRPLPPVERALRRFRRLKVAAAAFAAAALAGTAALALYIRSLPPLDLSAASNRSTVVLDREGKLLRPFLTADGRWKLPVTSDDVDPRYLAMLKAYEDKRFDSHHGIDPLGLARAAGQMLRHGRVVSGGSTLTMQVARLLEPRDERNLAAKLRQAVRAVELEQRFGKKEILDLYLNLAPFGGNLEGVRAASFAYFGKEPKRLSTAEAALLVALPQSPETRRPDRFAEAARKARARVLARVERAGIATASEVAAAREEEIPTARRPFPNLSPHVAEQVVAEAPTQRVHRLSLDARLQKSLEGLARERSLGLAPQVSIAILAVDNETGAVRASVGGVDYFAAERAGSLDLTRALRSPGSALKPFIYALAFDNGIAHPETMLEDRPARYGAYVPENFDRAFQGMVSARKALQLSLNVPAVELLSALGPQRFLSRLRDAGISIAMPKDGGAPGLAVGLGGLGITLQDLTRAYVGLARGGEMLPLRFREEAPAGDMPPIRLVEPVAAWYVADTLLGAPPPLNAVPGRIAYKTGTSYGYRDAWAVGFDRKHTIGVWVGRADNGAVPGLVGRAVAAPILFDAFARLGIDPRPFVQPPDAIVASTNHLPPPLRHLRQDVPKTVAAIATPALKLAFPPDGARIDLSAGSLDGRGQLNLKASGGAPPFTWLVDGAPVTGPLRRREAQWQPPGRGFMRISVIDGSGASESISIRLQ